MRSSPTSAAWSRRRGGTGSRSSGSSTPTRSLRAGATTGRSCPSWLRARPSRSSRSTTATAFEDTPLETVLVEPRHRATHRRRRADRCVHPLDAARRLRQGLRRDARQRRAHAERPDGMGRAAARPGDRAHQPVLDLPDRAGAHGGNGRGQRCRLRRHALTRSRGTNPGKGCGVLWHGLRCAQRSLAPHPAPNGRLSGGGLRISIAVVRPWRSCGTRGAAIQRQQQC